MPVQRSSRPSRVRVPALISREKARQVARVARCYRAYVGHSQDALNAALGWPAGRYARIEQGRHRVHREHVDELLAHAIVAEPELGCSLAALAHRITEVAS